MQRPVTTTTKSKKHKCEDTHIYCATWARDGECRKNPGMQRTQLDLPI